MIEDEQKTSPMKRVGVAFDNVSMTMKTLGSIVVFSVTVGALWAQIRPLPVKQKQLESRIVVNEKNVASNVSDIRVNANDMKHVHEGLIDIKDILKEMRVETKDSLKEIRREQRSIRYRERRNHGRTDGQ